jgi:hypothetical protein
MNIKSHPERSFIFVEKKVQKLFRFVQRDGASERETPLELYYKTFIYSLSLCLFEELVLSLFYSHPLT